MITEEMKTSLINHFEFLPKEQRPKWYGRLSELLESGKISSSEYAMRNEAWKRYYAKVAETSPAKMLFDEWKAYIQGKGSYSADQIRVMTADMKEKGLPEIEGKPKFPDPYECQQMELTAKHVATWLMKRQESEKKKSKKWEDL